MRASRVIEAQELLDAVSACGVEPPNSLVALVAEYDVIARTDVRAPDPTIELVRTLVTGSLRGAAFDKAIEAAARATQVAQFRSGLLPRVESAAMAVFQENLTHGEAQAIIDSLRKPFDAAASALAQAATLIDASADPVTILEGADEDVRQAWNSIKANVAICEQIGRLVAQFGCKSQTFGMVELPPVGGSGWLDDRVLMAIDCDRVPLRQACAAFNRPGTHTHRDSPWFQMASACRLATIEEAAEHVRAWAEDEWNSLHAASNNGRGYMDGKTFVPQPVPNPYSHVEEPAR